MEYRKQQWTSGHPSRKSANHLSPAFERERERELDPVITLGICGFVKDAEWARKRTLGNQPFIEIPVAIRHFCKGEVDYQRYFQEPRP